MKRVFVLVSGLIMITAYSVSGQPALQYYITVNTNVIVPVESSRELYPVLWYSKKTDPKFLVGGFGGGLSVYKKTSDKIVWKGAANLSRHVYWDDAVLLTDASNYPMGPFVFSSDDYSFHLSALAERSLTDRFSFGIGLGLQTLLLSRSRLPDRLNSSYDGPRKVSLSGYYKTLLPVIPVEFSYKKASRIYTLRYEQPLLNRYGSNLGKYLKDYSGILSFEYGWQIGKQ